MPQDNRYVPFAGAPDPRPEARATLDREHYAGAETMRGEWEHMWRKVWLLAGVEQDVAEPGDFFTFDIGRESILIARTEQGTLSAVYNVCQHRGNRLQALPYGSVLNAHSCPYHGWSYDLDGRLRSVPDAERFPQGVDCAKLSLKPVQVQVWAGLVWINMDLSAPPLEQFLGHIMDELAPYRIDEMKLVRDQSCALDANWKTVIDNFSEVYHVDFIHAQHASFVNCRDARVELFPYGHNVFRVDGYVVNPRYPTPDLPPPILAGAMEMIGLKPEDFRGRVADVREAAQKRKRALGDRLGFDYTRLSDEQLSDIWQYNIFPNIIMTVKPEEVWIMRPRPHPTDPDKCMFDKLTLAMPFDARDDEHSLVLLGDPEAQRIMTSGERPEREEFTQDKVNDGSVSMTETVDQDIFYLPAMQAGMHSAGFAAAHLSEDEIRISHMHDWLECWVRGSPFQA